MMLTNTQHAMLDQGIRQSDLSVIAEPDDPPPRQPPEQPPRPEKPPEPPPGPEQPPVYPPGPGKPPEKPPPRPPRPGEPPVMRHGRYRHTRQSPVTHGEPA